VVVLLVVVVLVLLLRAWAMGRGAVLWMGLVWRARR
jgi:hypothetical protein